MTLGARLLVPLVGTLMCSVPNISQAADGKAAKAVEAQPISLDTLSTAAISDGDYFAFAEPALCDEDENAYFLVVPHWTEEQAANPSFRVPTPRDVLRVSSDGKKRLTFSPRNISNFATATELKTRTFAVDRNGLYMLIWAEWRDKSGQIEKSGQYIVSFDGRGEYRSNMEVDWQEILVSQFDVFGSGEFLLRGRRIHPSESRVSILSASGQTLQDVGSWSGHAWDDTPIESRPPSKFNRMARGSDGRIYTTQDDEGLGDAVFAVSPSGQTERLFKVPAIPKDPPLIAWKAADDRFAASYQLDAGAHSRYIIAVYSSNGADASEGEPEAETTLYAAPGPLLCYQHKGSKDRFTFLTDGTKLVTMSSP